MKKPVYLDYAATTPVDPAVADEMIRYLTPDGLFGNPASRSHGFGWQAEAAVESARGQVASLIHADPREIVWTSGATESDNLAIKGALAGRDGAHLITSAIEHKAVVDTCKWLEARGVEVTWLEPGNDGRIQPDQVFDALKPETVLVSLMLLAKCPLMSQSCQWILCLFLATKYTALKALARSMSGARPMCT